jgi:carbamoyltransferase
MLRLGLKLLHDGTVALLDGPRLVVSHEAEKSANNARHARLEAIDLAAVLEREGLRPDDVERLVVDGWGDPLIETPLAARSEGLEVAPYHEVDSLHDVLAPRELSGLLLGGRARAYRSYMHVAGHAIGAYATSPFAATGDPALVLVWDGGMLPRLYCFTPAERRLEPLGPLFPLAGNVYAAFASQWEPFRPAGGDGTGAIPMEHEHAVPGKAMAYAGLGRVRDELFAVFDDACRLRGGAARDDAAAFATETRARIGDRYASADLIASLQEYLARMLAESLRVALERRHDLPQRLCAAGGCALNIAWNAALRASGLFDAVWVPPFPSDAGSALGTAAVDLLRDEGSCAIEWDVYRGAPLAPADPAPGWEPRTCSIAELARLLHETGEPVVFLNGRAELGPRALGARSVLCAASDARTKELLNRIKGREAYRPIAPICLEEDAPRVFAPGTPDPYMLYVHHVRDGWRERVPAIVHVDGTARLQTIDDRQSPLVAELLREYRRLSGLPLLCNTSANHKGRGFFPDARSAMEWGGASRVWAEGTLWARAR